MQCSGQDKITELLMPVAQGMGYEWVGSELVSQGQSSICRIYLDKPGGITIADCSAAFAQFVAVLTVEGLQAVYRLEVSSPGLDRPLFTREHWQQAVGQEVQVKLRYAVAGHRQYRGVVVSADEEAVRLTVGEEAISLPFVAVSKANLVPQLTFKRKK